MDPTIRFMRHSQLWEAGNTGIRRTAVSGIIFAAVVLLTVIKPYVEFETLEVKLDREKQIVIDIDKELAQMTVLEEKLREINDTVSRAPWNSHEEDLRSRFQHGPVDDPQVAADHTVISIAHDIRSDVVDPLRAVVHDFRSDVVDPLRAAVEETGVSHSLDDLPEEFGLVIDKWEAEWLGRRWIMTVQGKERTIMRDQTMMLEELAALLVALQKRAMDAVEQIQSTAHDRRILMKEHRARLDHDIPELEMRALGIREALEAVFPDWAKKLVTLEKMLRLYPWILVGVAVYLIGYALTTAAHYRGMADAQGWSSKERSDPLLSSIWTLTWRGALGTSRTVGCYSVVMLSLWYCLYQSSSLADSWDAPVWLPHTLMALAVLTVIVTPLNRRTGETQA